MSLLLLFGGAAPIPVVPAVRYRLAPVTHPAGTLDLARRPAPSLAASERARHTLEAK